MLALLRAVGRRGTLVLFLGVFLGLLVPPLAALLRPLLPPAVFLLLLLSLLRVDWRTVAAILRRPTAVVLMVAWLQVLCPLLVVFALDATSVPDGLSGAVALMAAAPPILSASAVAFLVGLDGTFALVVGLAATLLTPLTVPPFAATMLPVPLSISAVDLMIRLSLLIGGSVLGAAIIRRLVGHDRLPRAYPVLDGTVVLVMLVFAVAVMDGVADALAADPGRVALWGAAAFVANPLLQLIGAFVGARLGFQRALTVGLLTGNCNMGLLLAVLPEGGSPGILLFFAVAQIPMYTLPALLRPCYAWLVRRRGR